MTERPLQGLSMLVADDDALGGFRMRRRLVGRGARVAAVGAGEAVHYLGAPQLSAVLVGTLLPGAPTEAFVSALRACTVPWVVYGTVPSGVAEGAAYRIAAADLALLEATLAGLCSGGRRH